MNLDTVEYSTKPMNLGDHILCQRASKGHYEAMAGYIINRTNMTDEEVLALDDDELLIIVEKIGAAVISSIVLQQIAKTLDV